MLVPRVKLKVGGEVERVVWVVVESVYQSETESYVSPSADANASQTDGGSHISGTLVSMVARIPVVSRIALLLFTDVDSIRCTPTIVLDVEGI
jgi:hypothetical protein